MRPELCFNNEIAKLLPYVFFICNGDYALMSSFACSSAQPSNLTAYSMQSSLRGGGGGVALNDGVYR